jgi:hypothetical protein
LTVASAEYLDAAEQFIRALLNTPPWLVTDPERWVKTANFRLIATTLATAVLRASGKSGASSVSNEDAF